MEIVAVDGCDPATDAFLRGREDATVCHAWSWSDMIVRIFGHRAHYLVARESEQVRGVLPLMHVRSRLFGNQLVSQAFGNYGGPLFNDPGVRDALYHRAVVIAGDLQVDSIEFRNIEPLPYDLQLRTDKVSLRLPLVPDPDELWNGFKSETKVRNHIRKAEKAGVTTQSGRLELLDEYYDVYALRMHQLGTPCYSRKFMLGILETFPDSSLVFVARLGGTTVAARLVICFNGIVESNFGVTRIEYNKVSPNHALYWAVLKHYCLQGAAWFDFGRSSVDTGPYLFKKQWGSSIVQLHYQYWTRPGHPLSVLGPENPRYQRRIEMWKRLPHRVTRWLGPKISRSLP
jgi:FemAB-related protein (PEP-CTERM system-associated)